MTANHFFIHYKPGTEIKAADSLSRFSIHSLTDMREHKELVHDGEIKAFFDGSVNQSENSESWTPVVNKTKCRIDGNDTQFFYDTGKSPHILSVDDKGILYRKTSPKKQKQILFPLNCTSK